MRKLLIILALAGAVGACSRGPGQTYSIPASWSTQTITYAYPYDGQQQVAPTAPIVLHFSAPLEQNETVLQNVISITGPGGRIALKSTLKVDGGKGVILTPAQPLATNTTYKVDWTDLTLKDGAIKPLPNGVTFTTRAENKGARSLVATGSGFTVDHLLPEDPAFPVMDFSSERLQFTQPVDRKTVKYGDSLRLENAAGDLVPATILLKDRFLTVDPVSDLTPGQAYTLKLKNTIASIYGDSFQTGSKLQAGSGGYSTYTFTPKDSNPRETMVLAVPAGGVESELTGAIINKVPITSTLLGDQTSAQVGFDPDNMRPDNFYAELAFVPNYPNASPLRVKRGNFLTGASVPVLIAGKVPAGIDTGTISVKVISDANGYMFANPYSKAVDAPRHVRLTMDVAMSAKSPTANGAFTQDILHVEAVGTAIVKNGKLTMDAVGVTELQVLGLDQASGVLSFHLEGYADQPNAPKPVVDTTPPKVLSWAPDHAGGQALRARPGDPVIVNFDEVLDKNSVLKPGAVTLLKGGTEQAANLEVDGSAIVVRPNAPLEHGASYQVQLDSALITDLAGTNHPVGTADAPLDGADGKIKLNFALPALATPGSRAPMALSTYPGFPCASSGRNAGARQQGRCLGGKADDDILPIPDLPRNRSIQVNFSQTMNAASIKLGASCGSGSFRVEQLDGSGACTAVVPGRLEVKASSLRFTPDTPWTAGITYRYVLGSNGSTTSAAATCDGTQAICGSNGLPLQTQLIAPRAAEATLPTAGGAPMEIWFVAAAETTAIFQTLRGLPASDVNANFMHDAGEFDADNSTGVFKARNAARIIPDPEHNPPYSGLITGFNVGCPDGNCPEKQFSFITTALDADVVGAIGEEEVKVLIYPTTLVTSNFDIYGQAILATLSNPIKSGPLVIRIRYEAGPGGVRNQPITGTIRKTASGPVLSGKLEGYLDLPELDPKAALLIVPIPLGHNLHSYPLTINVEGPVTFLEDGRMVATLSNTTPIPVRVDTAAVDLIPAGTIYITIPAGIMVMEGVSGAIKP